MFGSAKLSRLNIVSMSSNYSKSGIREQEGESKHIPAIWPARFDS